MDERWRNEYTSTLTFLIQSFDVPTSFPYHSTFTKAFLFSAMVQHLPEMTQLSYRSEEEEEEEFEVVDDSKVTDPNTLVSLFPSSFSRQWKKPKRSEELQAKIDEAMEI